MNDPNQLLNGLTYRCQFFKSRNFSST